MKYEFLNEMIISKRDVEKNMYNERQNSKNFL